MTGSILKEKKILGNFSYLSAIQGINLLVVLATYPYLIRVLGKETFGLVVYAQAIVTYLVVLVSFGFQISATREVSVHRSDPAKLNEIFSSVMILKGVLFLLSLLGLILVLWVTAQSREIRILFLLTMFTCFYEFIFPSWFFQGIEKMGYTTFITLITKGSFFVLIFVFIRGQKDYLLVPLFNGVGSVLAGILSLWIVVRREKIRFALQPAGRLWYHFRESSILFASNLATQVYVNANKVIVGITLGMGSVALYDLAEKVVTALKLPQTLLNQALFPRISKERDLQFTRRFLIWSLIGQAVLYVLIFAGSPVVVNLLGGPEMSESTALLRLLAITVPLNAISSYLGIQYLVAHGHRKRYTLIILISVVLYALIITALWIWGALTVKALIGATIATEAVVLILMAYSRFTVLGLQFTDKPHRKHQP